MQQQDMTSLQIAATMSDLELRLANALYMRDLAADFAMKQRAARVVLDTSRQLRLLRSRLEQVLPLSSRASHVA